MSVARVKSVGKSLKPVTCERCREGLPKGSAYRFFYVGFRSKYKHVRCTKTECTPRTSELESSRMAEAYAAQEVAESELQALREGDPGEASDISSVIDTFGEALSDLGQEYRDADEAFGGGGMTDSSQRADDLESAADELQGFYPEEFDDDGEGCEKHEDRDEGQDGQPLQALGRQGDCSDCQSKVDEAKQQWWETQLDEADNAVSGVSF